MDNPFSDLIRIKNSLPKTAKKTAKAERKAQAAQLPPEAPPPPISETDAFLTAMDGVIPLKGPAKRVPCGPPKAGSHPVPAVNEDKEVLQHLRDLVRGNADFDLSFSDEFIEGHVKGLPEKLIRSLKAGSLPLEDRLDLHGHSLEEARKALSKFISGSSLLGKKTVLVIHGRGLRSPDKNPVLKSNLENLLLKTHIKKYILAFCSAKPCDGGTGASYVLLRDPRKARARKGR
ncbi:MAG: Smr/MutS family protein [Deltaproteobacteria bacterium]|jgi:DNA-nicking Smr family endonuclease|nr:Smr/MutS family protein [Deltaproteobacteria bacterium]